MTDPDAVRQARYALAQLAEAWPYLDDAKDATLRRGRSVRHLGAVAAATLDDLIRAERGDRLAGERRRLVPLPPMPTPLALDVVDAEQLAIATLVELSWLAASALRGRGFGWPPLHVTPHNASAFLVVALAHVGEALARDMADLLTESATALRAALGLDDHEEDRIHLHGIVWVTARRAEHELPGVTAANVRDWHRRGLVVDQHGNDRSLLSDRRRWYPLADLWRAYHGVRGEAA